MPNSSPVASGDADGPIFILGSARSGTSLLSRMLNSHPEIGVPFESMIYPALYPWRSYYGDLALAENRERLVRDVLSIDQVRRWTPVPKRDRILHHFRRFDFHGAVDALMRAWLETQQKPRWGEKTPRHAYYWREITQAFPSARFVHIVRDGRDAALSWKEARFGPRHCYALARRWVSFLDTMEDLRAHGGRIHELRYEDLLADPDAMLSSICEFLGTEFHDSMLDFHRDRSLYPTDKKNNRNLHQPLMAQNTGKWRSTMSQRDIRVFESIAGPALERYGYERSCRHAKLSRFELGTICCLEQPITRLYGMSRNRQGMVEAARLWGIRARLLLTRHGTRRKSSY